MDNYKVTRRIGAGAAQVKTLLMTIMTMSMIGMACAEGNLFEELKSTAQSIYSNLQGIVITVGGVCFIAACLIMLLSSSDKAAEGAKRWAIRIVIVIAIVAIMPLIFGYVAGLGNGDVTTLDFSN